MRSICVVAFLVLMQFRLFAASAALLGWNNLGMHCMDSDYSVFSVLPPYNTIVANLIVNGRLITDSSYSITYQAVADPTGSVNSTAVGKGNFYDFSLLLYGADLTPDQGLAGWSLPGSNNVPQNMLFEQTNSPAPGVATRVNWFRAEGIPISPFDDAGRKNTYPLMRLIARSSNGQPVATNDIVLPVSDEMDCRLCHGSGGVAEAEPPEGWVWSGIQERDYRLNILRLHDALQFATDPDQYETALSARGLNPFGLYRSVTIDAKPVLCASCHKSEALQGSGLAGVAPLTAAIHSAHQSVRDPVNGIRLDSVESRAACYLCHPGSATRCLRGAMGAAIAQDGSAAMQCQSCHGGMSQVGSSNRVGWFHEPSCGSCHTGTATSNSGQIRYTSAFTDTNFTVRVPANRTFSTSSDTPAPGLSLYRFSVGHGGLQCSACHGSTHAEYPSIQANDNLSSVRLQGHPGIVSDCTACHPTSPRTVTGGPHGMHPVGQTWVSGHQDPAENNRTQCQACHGTDYRGTVLSQMLADRTISGQAVFQGATVGCYMCHNGPSGDGNAGPLPTVSNVATSTVAQAVSFILPATGNGLTYRIIGQPANGSVGIDNNVATYFPDNGFVGTDRFTFAVYNGSRNSRLGTGTVVVAQGPVTIGLSPRVPPAQPAQWPVAFALRTTVTNSILAPVFDWNFGDGAHSADQFATHTYAETGSYAWSVSATVQGIIAVTNGVIEVGSPMLLGVIRAGDYVTVAWPEPTADIVLESASLLPVASWTWVTNAPGINAVTLRAKEDSQYFRLRRPW